MSAPNVAAEIRPISHQSTNDKVFGLVLPHLRGGARIVDVGAGEGYFAKMVGDRVATEFGTPPSSVLAACDLFPEFFRYDAVPCDPITPGGTLPYPDGTFDVVAAVRETAALHPREVVHRFKASVLAATGAALADDAAVLCIDWHGSGPHGRR